MLTTLIQSLIDTVGDLFGSISGVLPGSPFQYTSGLTVDNEILAFISWLVPFPQIISLLELWLVSVALYYIVMVKLRATKILE